MAHRWIGILLLGAAAGGCGPSLRYETRSRTAFAANTRCTQGPLDVRLRAEGARWGEGVEVWACSPRPIVGRWTLLVDGAERSQGSYASRGWTPNPGGGASYGTATRPDNRRCVAGLDEVAPGGSPSPDAAGARGSRPTATAAPARVTDVRTDRAERLVEVKATGDDCPQRAEITNWTDENRDPRLIAALKAGSELRLVLWSEMPNDLEGVKVFVAHQVGHPSVSEAEWVKFLERERLREERERLAEQAKADREAERHRQRCAAHPEQPECGPPTEQAPEAPREHAAEGPPPPPRADPQPPRPSAHAEWIPGHWRWSGFSYGWLAGQWRVPEEDRLGGLTAQAPAPPPPLRAEVVSAAPAPTWIWTPGYWAWGGASWVWVAGSWRVPPSVSAEWRPSRWVVHGPGVRFEPGAWIGR